jgi:hypothetical protein
MSKTFRPWRIEQPPLRPVTVQEFIDEDHFLRFFGRPRCYARQAHGLKPRHALADDLCADALDAARKRMRSTLRVDQNKVALVASGKTPSRLGDGGRCPDLTAVLIDADVPEGDCLVRFAEVGVSLRHSRRSVARKQNPMLLSVRENFVRGGDCSFDVDLLLALELGRLAEFRIGPRLREQHYCRTRRRLKDPTLLSHSKGAF